MAGMESRVRRGRAREGMPFRGSRSPEECGKGSLGARARPGVAPSSSPAPSPCTVTSSPLLAVSARPGSFARSCPSRFFQPGVWPRLPGVWGGGPAPRPHTIRGFRSVSARARWPEGGFAL